LRWKRRSQIALEAAGQLWQRPSSGERLAKQSPASLKNEKAKFVSPQGL